MQSVALFSNSSSPLNIPLCLRALFTPSRMKGAEGQFARPLCAFFQQISAAPFTLLALDSWQREWPGKIQPVFKKREKEKGVGRREGCATWFRVLYPCVSCEEGWMGIKESRKMNVSHEHSLPSFQADSIHLLSIPLPRSFYRALPCYTRVPSNGSLFRTIEEFHSIENPGSRWIIKGGWLWRFPFSGDNFFFSRVVRSRVKSIATNENFSSFFSN